MSNCAKWKRCELFLLQSTGKPNCSAKRVQQKRFFTKVIALIISNGKLQEMYAEKQTKYYEPCILVSHSFAFFIFQGSKLYSNQMLSESITNM